MSLVSRKIKVRGLAGVLAGCVGLVAAQASAGVVVGKPTPHGNTDYPEAGTTMARAGTFTLVGALSIVRFRNAIKETRDVGYIFFAMAIGMACGTRFYMLAIASTAALCAVLVLMFKLDLFARHVVERLLRVRLPLGRDLESTFEPVFRRYASDTRLIAVETVPGDLQEAVFTVVLLRGYTWSLPPQSFDCDWTKTPPDLVEGLRATVRCA